MCCVNTSLQAHLEVHDMNVCEAQRTEHVAGITALVLGPLCSGGEQSALTSC